ncbi:hypothetical protein Tco_1174594 [Tanacetum coccineum]
MTASRRVVKKKVTISADDNIIPDPDVALELGKSISLVEAKEEEASREVHATHARIVTESIPEPAKKKTGSRNTGSIVIQDTPSAPKSKPATSKLKLKGSKVESEYSKDDKGDDEEVDWIDSNEDEEKKDDTDDDKINDNEDEEMSNAEVKESGNDDEENTDAPNTNAGKTEEVKDDAMKVELPLRDTTDAEINSLLDIKIQYEVPHTRSPSIHSVYLLFIDNYLGSNLGDALQRALQKHSEDLIQTQSVKPAPDASGDSKDQEGTAEKHEDAKVYDLVTDKAALKKYDRKRISNRPCMRNKRHKRKHDDEDSPAGPNQGKKTKRRRTKESKSSKKPSTTKETPKGKAPSKGSKTGKSVLANEQ